MTKGTLLSCKEYSQLSKRCVAKKIDCFTQKSNLVTHQEIHTGENPSNRRKLSFTTGMDQWLGYYPSNCAPNFTLMQMIEQKTVECAIIYDQETSSKEVININDSEISNNFRSRSMDIKQNNEPPNQ